MINGGKGTGVGIVLAIAFLIKRTWCNLFAEK